MLKDFFDHDYLDEQESYYFGDSQDGALLDEEEVGEAEESVVDHDGEEVRAPSEALLNSEPDPEAMSYADSVDQLMSDFKSKKIDINKFSICMKPHCDRLAKNIAYRRRVTEKYLIDDFSQYLQILCITTLMERFDVEKGSFLNYLYSTGLFESGSFFAKNRLGVDTVGGRISYMVRDHRFADRVITNEDVESAKAAFSAQLLEDTTIKQAHETRKPRARNNITRPLTKACQEIKKVRRKLCLTQREFAELLHIDYERLRSYEYGRAQTPSHILDAARNLIVTYYGSDEAPDVSWTKKERMSDIVQRWIKQLEMAEMPFSKVAEALGVSRMTISRWRNNQTRPDTRILLDMQRYVDALERKVVTTTH